ncbi:hypothetical protein EIP91_011955 [Steccherinum ochraceum]|uniref:Uncharacterized protein n=1 Tax=Steccherinum ochraceum TaxID=92696 RepID=A0A4R0RQT3_9APHY|nr:hypothetical protein EIP91_011955 [Steccherinum ochraceum]
MRSTLITLIALMGAVIPAVLAAPIWMDPRMDPDPPYRSPAQIASREDTSDGSGAMAIQYNPENSQRPPMDTRIIALARRLAGEYEALERRYVGYQPSPGQHVYPMLAGRDDTASGSMQLGPIGVTPLPSPPHNWNIARDALDARFNRP